MSQPGNLLLQRRSIDLCIQVHACSFVLYLLFFPLHSINVYYLFVHLKKKIAAFSRKLKFIKNLKQKKKKKSSLNN